MRLVLLSFFLSLFYSCETKDVEYAIVIHGGAGTILKKNMSDEMENAYIQKMEEAINAGYNILEKNGSSGLFLPFQIKPLNTAPSFPLRIVFI